MINYPLKFAPILKERLWGGNKLKNQFQKLSKVSNIGESWEISDVEGDVSIVANGSLKGENISQLVAHFKDELVGAENFNKFGIKFPILIKFIDANNDLSVQVHPNDALSKKRHNSYGKTEMWYVMHADEGAKLVLGFNEDISKSEYKTLLKNKQLTDVLNYEEVKNGDVFFIETGTVHAIGSGIVIAEIQQTSDITYRIYDWDRVDAQGKSRMLHTELAVDAINFNSNIKSRRSYLKNNNKVNKVVDCSYFKTNFFPVKGSLNLDYSTIDSFKIFMCVKGNATIRIFENEEPINFGETVLIPASAKKVLLKSDSCELLEVTV